MHGVLASKALASSLIAAQCPRWVGLPVAEVASPGTSNTLYRLGDELLIRLPKTDRAAQGLEKELRWLPQLARKLPLAIPEVVHFGRATPAFPRAWGVFRWLAGYHGWQAPIRSLDDAAVALAEFILALRAFAATDGPSPGSHNAERGTALVNLDSRFRESLSACGNRVASKRVLALWERALDAPPAGERVWLHGDLQPANVLIRDGRLTAVIDFGLLGFGDGAVDLLPAWNLLHGRSGRLYGELLAADDAAWLRAQGWGLFQAIMALPHYWNSNRAMVRLAQRTLASVLAENP